MTTTLNLNLIEGKSYRIAFFASAPDNGVYTFSPSSDTPNISVNYEAMTGEGANSDLYDCFFKMTDPIAITSNLAPQSVILERPVAQINWGTNDMNSNPEIEKAWGTTQETSYIQSNLTVTGKVYQQLNILTGELDEDTLDDIEIFKNNQEAAPTGIGFPVDPSTFNYVACQYLLAPASPNATYNLILNINNTNNSTIKKQIQVNNAPLQANYRTNIYGNLLSTNTTFNITKDNQWGEPANNIDLITWDGKTVTQPTITGTNVNVATPSDLAGLAAMLNGDMALPAGVPADFSGYTVELNADFDMGSQNNFPMIGSSSRNGSNLNTTNYKPFRGTFDGQGHIIKNLNVTYTGNEGSDCVGFIPNLDGEGKLMNVTFDNVNINGGQAEQAGIVGVVSNGATVSGVHLTSGTVTSAESAGGIVGRVLKSGTISSCSNGASVSSSKWNVGGIVGAAYYTVDENTTMTIEGCTNTGEISGQYGVGGVVGLSAASVTNCTNEGTITATKNSVGGVIGEQRCTGTVSGCVNTGNITVESGNGANDYGCGGIIGWVRYRPDGDTSYTYQSSIDVTGNRNESNKIVGYSGVGGIVGMWYGAGTCTSNINSAESITAKMTFGAGIVGGSQWGDTSSYPTDLGIEGILYVQENTSTTSKESIIANSCGATIIYVNNTTQTVVENNTPANEVIPQ